MTVKLVDPMLYPLPAIGLRADGSPLYPICGSDGEEGGGDEGEGDEEPDPDDEEESDEEESDEDAKSKKKGKKTGPVSREEYDALVRRLSRADQRRSAAEKELSDLKSAQEAEARKGKPELENLRKDHSDLTKAHETLQGKFMKLARTNAFLTASAQEKINWHDPKVAMRAADLEDLEIDEDGNVEGINDAVKQLAKSHAYLVNKGKAESEDEDDKQQQRKRGASGSGVGSVRTGKGKQEKGKLTPEQLRARFPALKR